MPITVAKRYSRSMLRKSPNTLFIFGDNLARAGFGGQAKECRGEPNAVGVPTKKAPAMNDAAFLSDADFETAKPHIDDAFAALRFHVLNDGLVVFPMNGLGTGLADLRNKAPSILRYIGDKQLELREIDRKHQINVSLAQK